MKLVNPKSDPKRVKKLQITRYLLVGFIILAALVGSFVVMFPYIKDMLLTYHTSGIEIGFLYVLGILGGAVILLLVVCLSISSAIKKSADGVVIDGNIAVCDCGKNFTFEDLSWTVKQTGNRSQHSDDGTWRKWETLGNIYIKARCSKCGKTQSSVISNVVLESDVSVTKHKIAEDVDVTNSSKETISDSEIVQKVRDAYNSAKSQFGSAYYEYMKLGYKRKEDMKPPRGKSLD